MIDANDHVTAELPGVPPRWLQLLRGAVRDAGKGGVTKVAACLRKPQDSPSSVGKTYVRCYVSQVINGHLEPHRVSPHFIGAVLAAFGQGRLECPHLGADIAPGECQTFAARSYGAIEAADVPHWRACQVCLNNPANKTKAQA